MYARNSEELAVNTHKGQHVTVSQQVFVQLIDSFIVHKLSLLRTSLCFPSPITFHSQQVHLFP